jgi:hypothetical protein
VRQTPSPHCRPAGGRGTGGDRLTASP